MPKKDKKRPRRSSIESVQRRLQGKTTPGPSKKRPRLDEIVAVAKEIKKEPRAAHKADVSLDYAATASVGQSSDCTTASSQDSRRMVSEVVAHPSSDGPMTSVPDNDQINPIRKAVSELQGNDVDSRWFTTAIDEMLDHIVSHEGRPINHDFVHKSLAKVKHALSKSAASTERIETVLSAIRVRLRKLFMDLLADTMESKSDCQDSPMEFSGSTPVLEAPGTRRHNVGNDILGPSSNCANATTSDEQHFGLNGPNLREWRDKGTQSRAAKANDGTSRFDAKKFRAMSKRQRASYARKHFLKPSDMFNYHLQRYLHSRKGRESSLDSDFSKMGSQPRSEWRMLLQSLHAGSPKALGKKGSALLQRYSSNRCMEAHPKPKADMGPFPQADSGVLAIESATLKSSGDRWTQAEDAKLIEHMRKARRTAKMLPDFPGRTLWALRTRKSKLRELYPDLQLLPYPRSKTPALLHDVAMPSIATSVEPFPSTARSNSKSIGRNCPPEDDPGKSAAQPSVTPTKVSSQVNSPYNDSSIESSSGVDTGDSDVSINDIALCRREPQTATPPQTPGSSEISQTVASQQSSQLAISTIVNSSTSLDNTSPNVSPRMALPYIPGPPFAQANLRYFLLPIGTPEAPILASKVSRMELHKACLEAFGSPSGYQNVELWSGLLWVVVFAIPHAPYTTIYHSRIVLRGHEFYASRLPAKPRRIFIANITRQAGVTTDDLATAFRQSMPRHLRYSLTAQVHLATGRRRVIAKFNHCNFIRFYVRTPIDGRAADTVVKFATYDTLRPCWLCRIAHPDGVCPLALHIL